MRRQYWNASSALLVADFASAPKLQPLVIGFLYLEYAGLDTAERELKALLNYIEPTVLLQKIFQHMIHVNSTQANYINNVLLKQQTLYKQAPTSISVKNGTNYFWQQNLN